MMFYSRQTLGLGFALVLATLAALPTTALAGQPTPSPFAGHYVAANNCRITISESGRISDSGGVFSGRITDDGFIHLTFDLKIIGSFGFFGPPGGGRPYKNFINRDAIGIVALDEEGNLYGVLEWDDGEVSDLFWPRCD